MSELEMLRPTRARRVIDLVREAGVDVSDWANYADTGGGPGANPRYCYEWAFVEPSQVAVLNVWHEDIFEADGVLRLQDNLRAAAAHHAQGRTPGSGVWRKRAESFDLAVRTAASQRLPVRLIICDGKKRQLGDQQASKVRRRTLDSVPWRVTAYDTDTGAFTLTRGSHPGEFVDQFSNGVPDDGPTETRSVKGVVFARNAEVRRTALVRAAGHCEWCGAPGFETVTGGIFLETHHIVPLSEGGPDTVRNVAALCPTHHREAHYGISRDAMRMELLAIVHRAS